MHRHFFLIIVFSVLLFSFHTSSLVAQCTQWGEEAGPFSFTGLGDFPCGSSCGGIVDSLGFEAFSNEAYVFLDLTPGAVHTFSICDGYDAATWPAELTVIDSEGFTTSEAPGEIIDFVEDCSITFTIPEEVFGVVVVVRNLDDECGAPFEELENGFVVFICESGGTCTGEGSCYAGDVNPGLLANPQIYCPGQDILLGTDGTHNVPTGGSYVWSFTNTDGSGDGDVSLALFSTWTGDINEKLISEGYPALPLGTFEVQGASYDDIENPGIDCTVTPNSLLITITDGSDPACSESCEPSSVPSNNECLGAVGIESGINGPYDNSCASSESSDPDFGTECFIEPFFGEPPLLNNTLWFSFSGDGGAYKIHTTPNCASGPLGASYVDYGDTQMAIYEGSCGDLVAIACNEDDPELLSQNIGNVAGLSLQTEADTEYLIMIDGFNSDEMSTGEFCINIEEIQLYDCAVGEPIVATPPEGTEGSGTVDDPFVMCNNVPLLLETQGELVADPSFPAPAILWFLYDSLPISSDPFADPNNTLEILPTNVGVGPLVGNGEANASDQEIAGTYVIVPFIVPSISSQIDQNCTGIDPDIDYPVVTFIAEGEGSCDIIPDAPFNNVCETPYSVGSMASFLGPFSNEFATVGELENNPIDCFDAEDGWQNPVWFIMEGTGNIFTVSTLACEDSENLQIEDTQIALFADCGTDLLDCNDDIEFGVNSYSSITFESVLGFDYYLVIDGYDGAQGEFCFDIQEEEPDPCEGQPDNNFCTAGVELQLPQTSFPIVNGVFDNTCSLATMDDPLEGYECFGDEGLDYPLWFSFVGDGNTYDLFTTNCGVLSDDEYIEDGDTQMAIYTGDCDGLTPLACNEDLNAAGPPYPSGLSIVSTVGTTYHLLVDGFVQGNSDSKGKYCIEVRLVEQPNCVANAGTVSPPSNTFVCDGLSNAPISVEGSASIDFMNYFVLVDQDGIVIDYDTASSSFAFIGLDYGTYAVHAINVKIEEESILTGILGGSADIADVNAGIADESLCAAVSNGINFEYVSTDDPNCFECTADYGTINGPEDSTICELDDTQTIESTEAPTSIYDHIVVISSGEDGNIETVMNPGPIDLAALGLSAGTYSFHYMAFHENNSGDVMTVAAGGTIAELQELITNGAICGAMDVTGIELNFIEVGTDDCFPVSVSEIAVTELELYPVPATDLMYLRMATPQSGAFELHITDLKGRLVKKTYHDLKSGHNEVQIPIEGLPEGQYLLDLRAQNNSIATLRFVKL